MTVSLDRLRTIEEFAELTGTSSRLGRRLVAERRIRYVKVGRYVRIPDSAIAEFLDANTVEPSQRRGGPSPRRPARAAAGGGGGEPIRYLKSR